METALEDARKMEVSLDDDEPGDATGRDVRGKLVPC